MKYFFFPKKDSISDSVEKVVDNPPETWKVYPDTDAGRLSIIDMEYTEMKKTQTVDDLCSELIHLISACVYYIKHTRKWE